ncbi:PAAR-like domain-containing protein [Thalassococcus sp. S3]|uniref:PAAR-like domain-containing protein n=1 Tax=Thalassococcus sp. S3 TaxID=2017482 RepID=UPI00102CB93A|nr:PAAR-like domain-containing protein [Thalassococcus sp. S3]
MEKSAARHSGKEATIVCLSPEVCNTAVGSSVTPIPYMIISKLDWSQSTVTSTIFTGTEAFTMASRTNKVVDDEVGTKGGVVRRQPWLVSPEIQQDERLCRGPRTDPERQPLRDELRRAGRTG